MRRALVLRAREDAERTATKLADMGFAAILSPALEVVATGAVLPQGAFDAVLASSAKGLEHARDPGALMGLPLHAIGARTTQTAEKLGWKPGLVAGEARDMLPRLRARYASPARFLYLAGHDRQSDLETGLAAQGHATTVVETYDARQVSALTGEARAAIAAGDLAALHYSRRSAEIFLTLAKDAGVTARLPALAHFALSRNVAEPLLRAGLVAKIAEKPDEAHLLALLGGA